MLQNIKRMDLHKIFAETLDDSEIKGIELAKAVGKTPGYVSEVRRGVCGLPLENFGEWLEVCEGMRPGFKKNFARRIAQTDLEVSHLSIEDLALAIDSGRLSDDEVAVVSSRVADVVVAISKRLKAAVKKQTVSVR